MSQKIFATLRPKRYSAFRLPLMFTACLAYVTSKIFSFHSVLNSPRPMSMGQRSFLIHALALTLSTEPLPRVVTFNFQTFISLCLLNKKYPIRRAQLAVEIMRTHHDKDTICSRPSDGSMFP